MIAVGVAAGLAGGALAIPSLCAIAEIAANPTPVADVLSSTWTPLTGTATIVAGSSAFSGTFDLWPVALGLLLSLIAWVVIGILLTGTLHFVLGPRPDPWGALLGGAVLGGIALIALVPILVNGFLQSTNYAYESLPGWGWWIAFVTGGGLAGLVAARGLTALADDGPAGVGGRPAVEAP